MQKYFTPNASQPKEYPEGFNPPTRWICALHEDERGAIWLMKFCADIGKWQKERIANDADCEFFSYIKIKRCWVHRQYRSGCSACLAEVEAEIAQGRAHQVVPAITARPAPTDEKDETR